MHKTLSILRGEHDALAAMLRSLLQLLKHPERTRTPEDFELLRAMLLYIDEFPEKRHHPKESRLLFPKIRERSSAADAMLERLDRDHAHGEHAVRELGHLLTAWELLGETRRDAFVSACERYVSAYVEHMRHEEQEILPLAQQCLREEDWQLLDAAFQENRDPMTGHAAEEPYRELFRRIVQQAPAPIGVGPERQS